MNVNQAMQEAFDELLALSPEELRDRLKDQPLGPVGQLHKLLDEFGFINECSNCEFYLGKTPRCTLPSLTICPKADKST